MTSSFPVIVSGTSHRALADAVAFEVGKLTYVELGKAVLDCRFDENLFQNCGLKVHGTVARFADGEINMKIEENMRDRSVYIVQPTCPPVNDAIMELVLLIHTLRLASARKITAVIPYFGYARQDRKMGARTPISAAAVAQMLCTFKPTRIVTVDLHCGQIQGFFHNIPVDNLYADGLFVDWIRGHFEALKASDAFQALANVAIVSPDAGGVPRARRIAGKLGITDLVTVIKHRSGPNKIESMQLIGDVSGKACIICDDMCDTAGTVCAAATKLKEMGATKIIVTATHGLFSGPAYDRLAASCIDHFVVTNTVPQRPWPHTQPCMHVLDIAPLLGQAIHRVHTKQSLSALFE